MLLLNSSLTPFFSCVFLLLPFPPPFFLAEKNEIDLASVQPTPTFFLLCSNCWRCVCPSLTQKNMKELNELTERRTRGNVTSAFMARETTRTEKKNAELLNMMLEVKYFLNVYVYF